MKTSSRLKSYYREFKFLAKGVISTEHPILAHIIPMRRCNLACGYCNEYDDVSKPVPTEEMFRRIDKLADLGNTAIIISGGEPLMHPELEKLIARIRQQFQPGADQLAKGSGQRIAIFIDCRPFGIERHRRLSPR